MLKKYDGIVQLNEDPSQDQTIEKRKQRLEGIQARAGAPELEADAQPGKAFGVLSTQLLDLTGI